MSLNCHALIGLTSACRGCQNLRVVNAYGRSGARRTWLERNYSSKVEQFPYIHKPKQKKFPRHKQVDILKINALKELSRGLERYLSMNEISKTSSVGMNMSTAYSSGQTRDTESIDITMNNTEETNLSPVQIDVETFNRMLNDRKFAKKMKKGFKLVSSVGPSGKEITHSKGSSGIKFVEKDDTCSQTFSFDWKAFYSIADIGKSRDLRVVENSTVTSEKCLSETDLSQHENNRSSVSHIDVPSVDTASYPSSSYNDRESAVVLDVLENDTPSIEKKMEQEIQDVKRGKELMKNKVLDSHKETKKRQDNLNQDFNLNFLSEIEAFILASMLPTAHALLRHHVFVGRVKRGKKMNKSEMFRLTDVKIFNVLLHAWAKESDLGKVGEVWRFMQKSNVKPNMQSFAAGLECIGRMKQPSQAGFLTMLEHMRAEGLDVRNIFNEVTLFEEEAQHVKTVIKKFMPDFEPNTCDEYFTQRSLETSLMKQHNNLICSKISNPNAGAISNRKLFENVALQMKREKNIFVKVKSVYTTQDPSDDAIKKRKMMDALLLKWKHQFCQGISNTIEKLERKTINSSRQVALLPFLKVLNKMDYADIVVNVMQKAAMVSCEAEIIVKEMIGNAVYDRCQMFYRAKNKIAVKQAQAYERFVKMHNRDELEFDSYFKVMTKIYMDLYGTPSIAERKFDWRQSMKRKIGELLLEIALEHLKIDALMLKEEEHETISVPAFYLVTTVEQRKRMNDIMVHSVVSQLIDDAKLDYILFNVRDLPMVSPPLPWTSIRSGGYMQVECELIRSQDRTDAFLSFMNKFPNAQYISSFDALNKLSYCPWKIDTEILDIILHIFRNQGDKSLSIAPAVSTLPSKRLWLKRINPEDKFKIMKEKAELKKMKANANSIWHMDLYRLSIANEFRDEVFWFPHSMDFRSRVYPTSTYVNPQSNDVVRSFLKFAVGKPLGEKGLDWLKIHLINQTGLKKRKSNQERLKFANEKMDDILDSADNPLDGRGWWKKAENPWQSLAACKEIAKAIRSPDPEKYISHLHVHQDGSCNGLQHYAALGRDVKGAISVNLCPNPRPKDVYSEVVDLVEKKRKEDAANGLEIAEILKGFVKRKVIKQSVMTVVYGVTFYGAKLQIMKKLKDIDNFPKEHIMAAGSYLAENTLASQQKIFTAAKEIQDWFTIMSYLVSKHCNEPIQWFTPIGVPVLQPYFQETTVPPSAVGIYVPRAKEEIAVPNKQKNGFPPNYVHSLDSSHMMLTALYCWRAGITYASVHDCFWTHACDIDAMNKICREQFVALHSQPLLQNISADFLNIVQEYRKNTNLSIRQQYELHFVENIIKTLPMQGELDLSTILDSTYFFS